MKDFYGTDELCCWNNGGGQVVLQTREPAFADSLRKRKGAILQSYAVCGGYLKVFVEWLPFSKARQVVNRLLKIEKACKSARITQGEVSKNARRIVVDKKP